MALYTKCSKCKKKIPKGTECECSKERYKDYDKRVRHNKDNKKYTDFYNSTEWNRQSKFITAKYNGLCLRCLIIHGNLIPNDVVHHIEELRDNFDKRLDEYNLIPMCHKCHNTCHSNYTKTVKDVLKQIIETYSEDYI